MGKVIKKVFRMLAWVFLLLIMLLILFFFFIQQGMVQTYFAKKAAAYLSQELNTEVYIERLKIVFPLDIDITNLGINDKRAKPILRTSRLQFSLTGLRLKTHNIRVGRIALEKPEINLITYPGDSVMNFQFIIDYFSSRDSTESISKPWNFRVMNASISDGIFSLHDHNGNTHSIGMNYDHLKITNIYLTLSDLSYKTDTLFAHLHHLSAIESCGFILNRLRTDITVTPDGIFTRDLIVQTPNTELLLDLAFLFNDFKAFSRFTQEIYMQAEIFPSELDMSDLAYFVPDLQGMDNKFMLKGLVNGEVRNLQLKNFGIQYGSYTQFNGNISLDGLPKIRETFMHINARDLSTHYLDLQTLKLPSENGPVYLELPEQVQQLGLVRVRGRFTGFYNDFVSDGTFRTNYGSLTTDISLKYNFDTRNITYKGALKTRHFNLGKLTGQQSWLGNLNMNAKVDGKGHLPSTFDALFVATIDSLEFNGNTLNTLIVNGELADKQFNGSLILNDELINLDFKGLFDLSHDPPVFNFVATLDDANFVLLNLIDRDSTSQLSSKMEINFAGSNLDNLRGEILIKDTRYSEGGKDYKMDIFSLNAHPVNNGNRKLTLRSDYMDADFDGDFAYSQIYPAFIKILRFYLPSAGVGQTQISNETPEQSFIASITLKNTQPFSKLFLPDIVINKNAMIETRFNSHEDMVGIAASAPDITLFGTRVKNWHFSLIARNKELNMRTGASHFIFKEANEKDTLDLRLDKLLIESAFSGDTILYRITWDNQETPGAYKGDLKGYFTFVNNPKLALGLTASELKINSIPWWFNSDHQIIIDSSSVAFNNLRFESPGQRIIVDGKISDDPVEKISISFDQWKLSNLDMILRNYGVDVSGSLSGQVDLLNLYQNQTFLATLGIENFTLSKENLGNLEMNSSWDSYTKSVWIDSQIKYTGNVGTIIPFSLQGFYFPQSETNNLDMEVRLFNFKLETVDPFLEGILSDVKGLASGTVKLEGPVTQPGISGEISLMRTGFTVDFTNTRYSLADVVHIEEGKIYADNLSIFDEYGNTGTANIMFSHSNYSDWNMDIRVQANNLAGLQTTSSDNSLFYGTAYATGLFSLKGAFNDLVMDIKVRSGPETYIAIPISFAVDVNENDFIIFLNPESGTQLISVEEKDRSSFRINMDMDVTRDAVIQIFLPYQMGNIRSSGTGNMKMNYTTSGDFSMYGDYVTEQGTFLFTIQNMINRLFTLIPGGTIRWSGDPYEAQIDIQAIYKTRVTLNSLPNISDEYRNRRFPVDCVVSLKNSLMNPEISFGIRMPNVDEEIQRQVFSTVDTTNGVIMSRQMISLLVLNNFNFSTDQTNLSSTLGASSFELISNQLTNWLSQISKDFDIGVNYRPADQLSSEELEVALSTQLWDDRVLIDGNIGMSGERKTQQNASNIIGDINVEVKVTPDGRIRVRAFNKYNNQEITGREAPYTQGIGVFYRREFDRFRDLWIPVNKLKNLPPTDSNNLNGLNMNDINN